MPLVVPRFSWPSHARFSCSRTHALFCATHTRAFSHAVGTRAFLVLTARAQLLALKNGDSMNRCIHIVTLALTVSIHILPLRLLVKDSNSNNICRITVQQVQPQFLWFSGCEIQRIICSSRYYSVKRGYSLLAGVAQAPAVIHRAVQ